MLKPVELEIELFCRGMRIDPSCHAGEIGRRITRTRAGLGSGLEILIPSRPKDIWVNVPVVEQFAQISPLVLQQRDETTFVRDTRYGTEYGVEIPAEPEWYSRKTTSGTEMSRVGVLQGNYLGIYVSARCLYWSNQINGACKFCTTGKNVGTAEETRKRVDDVVEVARAAQQESGSIFTHFNTGYHYEDQADREEMHGLRMCEPYVRAVRQQVGGFIGVQAVPVPRRNFHEYDELIEAGTDHFSFCYEFEDPEWFERLCPGKAQTMGQSAFFEAMEYTAKKLGRGRVAGEIIAGVEPIEATKRGIDRIVNAGAFPTVCIFRPTIGSEMENVPPPDPEAMRDVFAYLHQSCRRAGLPVGVLPIEVSLVVQPEETAALVEPTFADHVYSAKNWSLRQLAKPYVAWKLRPAV
jgi:solute carrier family 13 (sodium-dependent dicarboxylate transporter), member 2/3/5